MASRVLSTIRSNVPCKISDLFAKHGLLWHFQRSMGPFLWDVKRRMSCPRGAAHPAQSSLRLLMTGGTCKSLALSGDHRAQVAASSPFLQIRPLWLQNCGRTLDIAEDGL